MKRKKCKRPRKYIQSGRYPGLKCKVQRLGGAFSHMWNEGSLLFCTKLTELNTFFSSVRLWYFSPMWRHLVLWMQHNR